MRRRLDLSLWMTGLLCAGILVVSAACDHGSSLCHPDAPLVQVQAADGVVTVASTITGAQNTVVVLSGSDGQQLQHVANTDQQLTANGIVYISKGGLITALQVSDGKQLWQSSTGGGYTPTVIQDGVLYALGLSALYALRISDGTALWQFQPPHFSNEGQGGIKFANGLLYIGGGTIFAIHVSDGTLAWQFTPTALASGSGIAIDNGVVYAAMNDSMIYALQADNGHQLWTYQAPPHSGASFTGGLKVANGMVYVPDNTALVAIQASNGKLRWRFNEVGAPIESFEVSSDAIYVRSLGSVTSLRPRDAKPFWTFDDEGQSLVLDREHGVLYVGGSNGQTFALRLSTGSVLWQASIGVQPQTLDNGVLYLAKGGGGCMTKSDPYIDLAAIQASSGKVLWQKRIS